MDEPVSSLHLLLLNTSNLNIGTLLGVLVLLILLAVSALISGSEVAFFSLDPKQLKQLKDSKNKRDQSIIELFNNSRELLATILISNNFVNVAIILLSTLISERFFTFSDIEFGTFVFSAAVQEILINLVAITFMILMAGEVVPKVYASKYPIQLARIMTTPLKILKTIFTKTFLVPLLVKSTGFIDKKIKKKTKNLSVEEIPHALEIINDQSIEKEEEKILKGIVKFGNTDVKQIMTPRVDVSAVESDLKFNELIDKIVDSGYSRIPVYEESFDNIKGILYIKDLLPYINNEDNFNWTTLIREAIYVPENKKIDDLLEEFQEKKIHLAIVVDEYGGSSGIVSLEDVIEEIVGDISDEFDTEDIVYSKLDENNFVFEGKTPLNDMYRVLNIDGEVFENSKGESDSLAGFVLELFGKIPQKNEKVKFYNYTFTVEAADRRRIKQVKVTISKEKKAGKLTDNTFLIFLFGILLFTSSCTENYTPKPRAYFRITLPENSYQQFDNDCPFKFEYSKYSIIDYSRVNKSNPCWFNIYYPKFNAKVHFSYVPDVADSINKYMEQSRGLAMKHIARANDIQENIIMDDSSKVYGTTYNFEGSTATCFQFFLTDSVNHFFRGALYFESVPNPDSTLPVETFIKKDLDHLIQTFEWK